MFSIREVLDTRVVSCENDYCGYLLTWHNCKNKLCVVNKENMPNMPSVCVSLRDDLETLVELVEFLGNNGRYPSGTSHV